MELRQLSYLVAIVEAGSFTAAAATLHMSQPPLSLAIANLERELGVTLLVRSARGARPTSAGSNLLEYAYRILSDVEEVTSNLALHSAGAIGRVSIAAVPSLIWSRLPGFLNRYSSLFPEVDIRLTDASPLEVLDMTSHRTVDIGFIVSADNEGLAEQYSGQLQFADCGELPLVAVLPLDESLPDPIDLSVFRDRVLLVPRRSFAAPSLAEIVEEALGVAGITPRAKRTVDNIPVCLPLVSAGMGVAILPDMGADAFSSPHVTVRRIEPALRPLQVGALWHRLGATAPVVQRMQELIASNGLS
ncbi:MAG TPA: LysR family transcriptional regulator [Pseudolysinimonas sp.]|nr:LysR family transcriptional regulator [Pseudolysinimonas sp.]